MDSLGGVAIESLDGLDEEEKNEYLKEFLLPIIASVDEENASAITEEMLKVDVMFDAISDIRDRLGLYRCLL